LAIKSYSVAPFRWGSSIPGSQGGDARYSMKV
jgi:hypothetical protein